MKERTAMVNMSVVCVRQKELLGSFVVSPGAAGLRKKRRRHQWPGQAPGEGKGILLSP